MVRHIPLRFLASLLVYTSAVGAISCTTFSSAKEVTAAQMKAYVYGPSGHYSTMFTGVRYAGSDEHFDYVVLTYRDGIGNRMFKIRAGELGLKAHMALKRNDSEWTDASADFPFPQPSR